MSGIKSSLTKVSSLLLVALGFFSCQDTITLEGEGIISGEAFDTNQNTSAIIQRALPPPQVSIVERSA